MQTTFFTSGNTGSMFVHKKFKQAKIRFGGIQKTTMSRLYDCTSVNLAALFEIWKGKLNN